MVPDSPSLSLFSSGQASVEGALEPAGPWAMRTLVCINLQEPLQIQLGLEDGSVLV